MASAAATSIGSSAYQLSDDLARLCLPQEFKDSYRNLAWANSICALFLLVGLVGLKQPEIHVRKIVPPTEPAHVVIVQPEDLPKPAEIKPPEDLEIPDEPLPDVPTVVTVVAAEAPGIKFSRAVEVAGAVAVAATPTFASPPPKNDYVPPQPQAPQATKFTPNASDTEGGFYPRPEYPKMAIKMKQQGSGKVDILVDASGAVTSVKITESAGYGVLDDAIVQTIKTRWRFPPGRPRHFWYPFVFEMGR
jgi:protein TonB